MSMRGIGTRFGSTEPEKRQRTAALHDALALHCVRPGSGWFWTEAVLCRFLSGDRAWMRNSISQSSLSGVCRVAVEALR